MPINSTMRSFSCLVVPIFVTFVASVTFGFAQTYHPDPLEVLTDNGVAKFRIEIADTAQTRSKGLMHREFLPSDAGMLFCFDQIRPVMMWMKNTPLPLDMIFISEKGVVSSVETDSVPFSTEIISSSGPVLLVLELNAGAADQFQIKIGNRVKHPVILSCASRMKRVGDPSLQ